MPTGSSFFRRIRAFLSGTRHETASQGSSATTAPAFLAFRSSTVFIIFTVCLAIFTDILCYGLIVPVIPFSLTVQAGVPEDDVQRWTAILLAVYNATLFVGSPLAGLYADYTSSRRLPLLLGLLALCASTLLLCLGKSIVLLLIGRLLQGLSAAVVWSVGLALLVDSTGRNVGYAMGYVSIAMSVGFLISPVIGGAVYDSAGYYAVFYPAFAAIALDIILRLLLIEKKIARQWITTPADAASPDAQSEHTASAIVAPAEGEKHGPYGGNPAAALPTNQPVADSGQSPAAISEDNRQEGLDEARVTPPPAAAVVRWPQLELIKSRRILAVLLGIFIQATVVFAFDTVVPIFVKNTFGWNSTAAGLVFISVMVPGFAAPLAGMLADRYGTKWLSAFGFLVSIPSFVCLRFVTENSLQHKVLLCALLAVLGAMLFTLVNTVLMAEMTYSIDAKEAVQPGIWGERGVYGAAYGLWNTSFALGGVVGSLSAGYLNDGPGWGTVTWSLAVFSFVGLVASFGYGSKPPKKPDTDTTDATPPNTRDVEAGSAEGTV